METRDRPELKELPMAVGSYSMLVCEGGGGDGEGGVPLWRLGTGLS